MVAEPQIKPRWTAIEIDETKHLSAVPEGTKLFVTYMFDRNEVTHICSQVKNHWLEPVNVVVSVPDGVTEGERDRLEDELRAVTNADYYTENSIEALIKADPTRIVEYGELGEDETKNDVREHWQGNPPF